MNQDKRGSIEIVLNERDYNGQLTGRKRTSGQTDNPQDISKYYLRNSHHQRKAPKKKTNRE